MTNNEIMIEIKDEDLEELAEMYKPHEDALPQVYSFILTCIISKKNGMPKFVTVMSPNDCWRKDGTFFALMPNYGHDIFFHSLDTSGETIVQGLLNTKKFKFPLNTLRSYTLFFCIHEYFYPRIMNLMTHHLQLSLLFCTFCTMYCLRKEYALRTSISIPSNVYIKEVNPEEASIMNSVYPHSFPGSTQRLAYFIKLNGGYGVYLKSNDQLVAWITLSCLGQLSALQTLEEHKRKGYGKLITLFMCRKLAEKGLHSFATVNVGNKPSELLFDSLGFKKLGSSQYFGVQMV